MARTTRRGRKAATGDGALAVIHAGREHFKARATRQLIARLTAEWSYTLRQRSRWAHDKDLRTVVGEYAVATLGQLGITEDDVSTLARAARLEVELFDPSAGVSAEVSAAASEFPWEYVLSSATRERARAQPVLITRLLRRTPSGRAGSPREATLTVVTSAPGRIGDIYSFETEVERLAHAVESTADKLGFPAPRTPPRPTLKQLAAHLLRGTRGAARSKPRFVHVSGVDPNQAAALVPGIFDDYPEAPADGLLLSGQQRREEVVDAVHLAEALVPGAAPPALVTLNLHYSAARTAREVMRRGAGACLGFMDAIPDEVAEYFFTVFYAECHREKEMSGIPRAFQRAWDQLADQGHDLHGTGVVLWLCEPAVDVTAQAPVAPVADDNPDAGVEKSRGKRLADVLAVDVDLPEEINYSLLHNQRSALTELTLSKLVPHRLDDVRVEVELDAGEVKQAFRQTFTVDEPHFALAERVKLPLTAPLLRSLRERLQTTVYTRVTWEGRVAHEETRQVALLPVDEWHDDTRNNPWLPSFVLPRDPAVARIIAEARKYLIALTDDPNAGFDGYQQIEDADADPSSAAVTDLQVQAIWTALINDRDLLYINPPPAYSRSGQRLRTPSEVLATSSGTCIDLSLLLAACLEYVDIHACLVLLTGHCFVGYWRAEDYQSAFMTVSRFPEGRVPALSEVARRSPIELVDRYGWRLGPQCFDEIHEHLRADELRMLEATGLCFNYSFEQAQEEGAQNMNDRSAFDSLLDIRVARRSAPPVTPLPIISDGREP